MNETINKTLKDLYDIAFEEGYKYARKEMASKMHTPEARAKVGLASRHKPRKQIIIK